MALTIPCVSSLRVTPHQVLQSFHCSLQLDQLGTSRRKEFLWGNPLALPVVKGSQRLCRRRQASRPSPDSETTRMSNDSPSTKVISTCVQLICKHSQSVQKHHNFCCCVRFCHCCRISFHGPRQDISSLQGVLSRRSSLYVVPKIRTHSPYSSTVEDFPKPFVSKLDWFVLDLLRPTLPIPLSAQGTVVSLTKLGTRPCC